MNKCFNRNLNNFIRKYALKFNKLYSPELCDVKICCCHFSFQFNTGSQIPKDDGSSVAHRIKTDIFITNIRRAFPNLPITTFKSNIRYSSNESTKPQKCEVSRKNETKSMNHDETKLNLLQKLIQNRILTVPNILTTIRIVLTPLLCYLVLQHSYTAALSIFVFAGFTDLLDGLIARSFQNQTSDLGSFLDPLADKLLVSTLFLSLSYVNLIPVYLALIVITRDALLTSSGIYIRYTTLSPRPKSLKEFFDPTNRSVKLQPTMLSKFNTAVQLTLVATTLASPVFNFIDHPYVHTLWYLTAATTVASGIGYIFAKDTFKFVEKTYIKKRKN